MPRLLGVEIPADKRIEASLTYIYGIGPSGAKRILEQTNIDPNLRAKDLTPHQINEIIQTITGNKMLIEGDLRRELQSNLKRLQAINCYRGIRHRRGLPGAGPADFHQRAHPQRPPQDRWRYPEQGRKGRQGLTKL